MQKFITLIKKVNPTLNAALGFAILCITLIDVYLKSIPEIFPWGAEFGSLLYSLCLSIIASYIFFFIVVHIKQVEDEENIRGFVKLKINRILGDYKSQINEFKKSTASDLTGVYFGKDDFDLLFLKINPQKDAPLIIDPNGRRANWVGYMLRHKVRADEMVEKILINSLYLESELISLLVKLTDYSHFSAVEHTHDWGFGNTDMKAWASGFYEYSLLCKKLEHYASKKW